jgi:hypothetical protein
LGVKMTPRAITYGVNRIKLKRLATKKPSLAFDLES